MLRKLLYYPHPNLKLISDEVGDGWAQSSELKDLYADLAETMISNIGIGLAAPQVDIPMRVFVMAVAKNSSRRNIVRESARFNVQVFVDPVIEEHFDDLFTYEEGCLSVPGVTEEVQRWPQIAVSAWDIESNQRLRFDLYGIEARCAQHEIDHLDGKMFTDGYGGVKRDIAKRKIKKFLREESR